MEGWRTIEQDRMFSDHFIENIPDILALLFHHLLGALDRSDVALLFEFAVDEGLEELQRHFLRQPALMQPQLRTDHDDRAPGVINPLTQQILPEAPRFALEHVGEGFERALCRASDGAAAPSIIEQRVNRLLEHALFVAYDNVWCVELD